MDKIVFWSSTGSITYELLAAIGFVTIITFFVHFTVTDKVKLEFVIIDFGSLALTFTEYTPVAAKVFSKTLIVVVPSKIIAFGNKLPSARVTASITSS